jgi:tetratricopeptide (TPR) repeat protein
LPGAALAALAACEKAPGSVLSKEYLDALALIEADKGSEALPLLEEALRKEPQNPCLFGRYLKTLVSLNLFDRAKEAYAAKADMAGRLAFVSKDMGRAFFETEDYEEAQRLYEEAFDQDSGDAETLERIVFSSCRQYDYATAGSYLERAEKEKKIQPHVTVSLKTYLLQRMGSPELALSYVKEAEVEDRSQVGTLRLQAAADRMEWDEFDVALQILEQEVRADPENPTAQGEYMAALSRKHRMKDVLDRYGVIRKKGLAATARANEAIAEALTYLKRPREAERFYKLMLEQNPSLPFRAYMGLFTTYTTLHEPRKAEEVWAKIDLLVRTGKLNWMEKHEAQTARGWFLISEDRLREAQDFFEARLREAGLDPGFRQASAMSTTIADGTGRPWSSSGSGRTPARTISSPGWGWPTP